MIYKFHRAKAERQASVTLWGTGSPRRELLHADDLAAACLLLLDQYESPELINVGTGEDVTIKELAGMVQAAVGYEGEVVWDTTKPDGTPRKLMDVTRIRALGWTPRITLAEGIASAHRWFLDNQAA